MPEPRFQPRRTTGSLFALAVLLLAVVATACGAPEHQPAPSTEPADVSVIAADAQFGADAAPADLPAQTTATVIPGLLGIAPDRGSIGAMNTVTITGHGLDRATQVRFGDSPALDLQVLDENALTVTVPPRPAGVVDVTVVSDGRPDAVGVEGYRYVAQVEVTGVVPASGPTTGGTPLMITGNGFKPGTVFVVGDRLAIHPVVLDEHTAAVLAPPGHVGPASVAATNEDGTGVRKAAYSYRMAPKLERAEPALGPLTGGGVLVLYGEGLVATGAKLTLTRPGSTNPCTILGAASDGKSLTAKVVSATVAGVYDVVYANADGAATLVDAYAYVDASASFGSLAIATVSPAALPANALKAIDIGLVGTLSQKNLAVAHVWIGGKPANVLWSGLEPSGSGLGATLRVLPPGPPEGALPQVVDVTVDLGAGAQAKKVNAFQYLAMVPKITAFAPGQLQAAGGTPVQLQVKPLGPGQKVVGLRIGALLATQVQAQADGSILALAPEGAPGQADVAVLLAGGAQVVLAKAAEFVTPLPMIGAILPAMGAQSGGQLVDVVGSGLDALKYVSFDGAPAKALQVLDSGHARLRTPPGDPGPATVEALFVAGSKQNLPGLFTYFDPSAGNEATWGDAIDGSVNVTVLRKGKMASPIQGALVTLGPLGEPAPFGLTDDRGQVTLSASGLHGPVHVHAAKAGYTAGSVIALGVENVTIRLLELPKPDDGSGSGGGTGLPLEDLNGHITGTVLDAEKYTQLPAGTCAGQATASGNCSPCQENADCNPGATCEVLVTPGLVAPLTGQDEGGALPGETTETANQAHYCVQACSGDETCAPGFECRMVGATYQSGKPRCVPRIGTPQVRCETAAPSIFGGALPAGPGGIVDSQHHFTVHSPPGVMAIVCKSGYVDAKTGLFVALSLGLARHVAVPPKGTVTGIAVVVNVRLNRRVRVRMDRLPVGPDTVGALRSLTAGLDLGAEGYIPVGTVATNAVTDVLDFERQPEAAFFTGANSDVRYELYGGLGSPVGGPPNSTATATGLDVSGLDRHALWSGGTSEPSEGDQALGPVHALASGGDTRVGVGDGGRIVHWTGGGFTVQASPTKRDLFAVWLTPAGEDGWAAGEDGVLVRRMPLGWKLWSTSLGARIVAITGRAGNDVWAVDTFAQMHHWDGKSWSHVAGPWPASQATPPPSPTQGPPPRRVHALWQAPTGALFLAADEGKLLRADPDGKAGLNYKTLTTLTTSALHGLTGTSEMDVWVSGDRGFLAHWTGSALTKLTTGTDRPLYAIRSFTGSYPLHVVGGQGTWLRVDGPGQVTNHSLSMHVDLRGALPTYDGGVVAAGEPVLILGPYLELPYVVVPQDGQPLQQKVQWQTAPGVTPTLNIVRISDQQYVTRWEMFVRGNVTQVALPDFQALGQFNPLPKGPLLLRIWRVYAAGLDIDHFDSKALGMWTWTSWAYNVVTTSLDPAQTLLPNLWPDPTPGK